MLTAIQEADAIYNARDVLSMCRMYPHLVEGLETTNTHEVYEYDEQLAWLALQMTRIGIPVNSDKRAEIGARLRKLRDEAIEQMRPFTEGAYRNEFIDWIASFFAVKARKGEPVVGDVYIGPTRAKQEYEDLQKALVEWKAYKKQIEGEKDVIVDEYQAACAQIDDLEKRVKEAKQIFNVSQFCDDSLDGTTHSQESAFGVRFKIRRSQAVLALDKVGVKFSAKIQQCAILRAAGVPLHRKTEKTGLPKIDKEILEGLARHQAAKALLQYILTEKTINVYIEGEKRAGKGGGKSRPVMVTEDGYIHPIWGIHRITGRWNSSPNCFDGSTEVFVYRAGASGVWIKLSALVAFWNAGARDTKIAQYNPESGSVEWCTPENPFMRQYTGRMVRLKHAFLDLFVTEDHRLFTCQKLQASAVKTWEIGFGSTKTVDHKDLLAREIIDDAIRIRFNFLAFLKHTPRLVLGNDVEVEYMWQWSGPVYCLSVPSSYIIVRRNDKVCVVGQCQNWSKRAGGGAENLRAMIEAPEGYTLIGADQKQLEARLIGAMSQCKYMLDVFASNSDIHGAFAAVGFPDIWPRLAAIYKEHKAAGKCHCEDCLTRDKLRDVTKRLEYGACYGGAEQTLFESIVKDFPDSTLGQVRNFLKRFDEMLPEVLLWRKNTLEEAIRDGAILSPILGRRQVFPLGRVDPNVAYNYKAQSGGADIWAIGAILFMQRWNQAEFDARLIQNGHDSVLVLVREELAAQVDKDVCDCWSMHWNGVNFEMESKIAKQWSET